MTELIGLADVNNFFYSCECVLNPRLCNKPVVVLSNNDGCVAARSNEAKKIGVAMGEAVFKRRYWFRQQGIIMLSANFALYNDYSRRTFDLLETLVPKIERYSIDEAFFHPIKQTMSEEEHTVWSKNLSDRIMRCLGIPVSIGIARSKTLAKIAVRLAKQRQDRQYVLTSPTTVIQALRATPIKDVWGIGPKRAAHFHCHKIHTAFDFACASPSLVQRQCGSNGLLTHYELRGHPCYSLQDSSKSPQSCLVSRSFGKPIYDIKELQNAIARFTNSLARKLRHNHVVAKKIGVFLRTNRFKQPYFAPYKECAFSPTSDTASLNALTGRLLKEIFDPNHAYKRAGIIAPILLPDRAYSDSLFDDRTMLNRRRQLWQAVDTLNIKYGTKTLRCGHLKSEPPHQKHRSAYTIHMALPEIH